MAREREGKSFKKKYCKLCFEKVGFVVGHSPCAHRDAQAPPR